LAATALLAACSGGTDPLLSIPDPNLQAQLGDANPNLPDARLQAFARGKAVFGRVFTRAEGHGPDFNTDSCVSCHEIPVLGGSGPRYRNFYIARDANRNNFFQGNQLVARTFSYTRMMRESMAGATTVAQRNTPPLFGVGLFERISEDAIKANADPFDSNGDRISGRVNLDGNRVGRFGYKAQESGLEDFIRGPLFNQMGVTSNPLSQLAQVSTTDQPTRDQDGVNDPEISRADISDMLIWLQELAPPAPLPMDSIAMRGEQVFSTIGCNKCHIPNLVLNGPGLDAYTDLLLHDMGPGLADGIAMSLAGGNEFRTQPLWGLRHHAPYLHDGRADTVDDAILAHGGEALAARTEYARLDGDDRQSLLQFLGTR